MKALSVRPPWAWALVFGGKTVENRPWSTRHRGPLLIHVAKTAEPVRCWPAGGPIPWPAWERRGDVIGLVDLVDCQSPGDRIYDPWAFGPCCWVVTNPRPVVPFPVRGRLGLFDVPDELVELLR